MKVYWLLVLLLLLVTACTPVCVVRTQLNDFPKEASMVTIATFDTMDWQAKFDSQLINGTLYVTVSSNQKIIQLDQYINNGTYEQRIKYLKNVSYKYVPLQPIVPSYVYEWNCD